VAALLSSVLIDCYASHISVEMDNVPVLGTNVAAVLLAPEQPAQLCDTRTFLSQNIDSINM
jgi:hypothetical protein